METIKFEPNRENIKKRLEIQPFGKILQISDFKPVEINFNLYDTTPITPVETKKDSSYKYVPPMINSNTYKPQHHISIRLTNIPLNITQNNLNEILTNSKCKNLFTRCYLVMDRETNVSKGLAYINCKDMEKAKEFAKIAKTIIIDSLVLGVEILNE